MWADIESTPTKSTAYLIVTVKSRYEHTLLYFALQRPNALSKSQCYADLLKTSAAATSKSWQPKNKKSENLHSNIISYWLQKSN